MLAQSTCRKRGHPRGTISNNDGNNNFTNQQLEQLKRTGPGEDGLAMIDLSLTLLHVLFKGCSCFTRVLP